MKKFLVVLLVFIFTFGIVASAAPLANTSKISYIKQGTNTCKATSLAMALNLIVGSNQYSTASLGYDWCENIDGRTYKGYDGYTYKAIYKQDSYVGKYSEEKNAIDKAINAGIPAVAAVHSKSSQRHWILVVGKSGNDYLIVDPWTKGSGSGSIINNAKSLSSSGYSFGLKHISPTRYGYVTFEKVGTGNNSSNNNGSSSGSNVGGSYFAKCSSSCTTITSGLNNIGVDSSYSYRAKIAAANNISGYKGTASQNTQMLNLLKQGKLLKPGSTTTNNTTTPTPKYFAKCSSSCTTITSGLKNIGADSSYSYRAKIAAANNISGYRGTAAQNTQMLSMLKKGTLKKP